MFQVDQLSKCPYLKPVSFSLAAEEVLVLSGVSGSGKSVLLRAIADLDPHDGDVRLEDKPQSNWKVTQWRKKVMWFPAETAWWEDSVATHFPEIHAKSRQDWWLSALDKLYLPSSILKKPVDKLSSGEKQRLALIRGLIEMPQVLLLDEVTANLDPESTLAVESLISEYLIEQQACAIWVTHDPQQAKRIGSQQLELHRDTVA
ncbi:ATP-binding cassette domain-containing protein [Hydrogenovibrio sp. 3SP14C1]|uniref:ABC transporter ATP-binding protein n=1 Tax=Hydrogenovibrio sp. 3SP14C1 TaxID=3038774 RepID=UPI0024164C85|nr:ATP-binding cassette domain-containing protein [Hydrogenovibrio sp. 3SP14C1]MDG4813306.1 ATP-binding cassette domain-containing protein [Hydrogenovibrio sp. 3SP14C1]